MEPQRKKPPRLIYSVQQAVLDKEINRLKKKAETARAKWRRPVIASIVQSMREFDISPQDVVEAYQSGAAATEKPGVKSGKLPPKYRHPQSGEAWSGRGKTPRWLREAELAGLDRESFRVY